MPLLLALLHTVTGWRSVCVGGGGACRVPGQVCQCSPNNLVFWSIENAMATSALAGPITAQAPEIASVVNESSEQAYPQLFLHNWGKYPEFLSSSVTSLKRCTKHQACWE
jgi:hypothetical protein